MAEGLDARGDGDAGLCGSPRRGPGWGIDFRSSGRLRLAKSRPSGSHRRISSAGISRVLNFRNRSATFNSPFSICDSMTGRHRRE